MKEGKIKNFKPFPEIDREEIPYQLPETWEWVKFASIVQSMTNGLYKPSLFYADKGIKTVRIFNIQDGFLNFRKK